jgi:hypothetical protein
MKKKVLIIIIMRRPYQLKPYRARALRPRGERRAGGAQAET